MVVLVLLPQSWTLLAPACQCEGRTPVPGEGTWLVRQLCASPCRAGRASAWVPPRT